MNGLNDNSFVLVGELEEMTLKRLRGCLDGWVGVSELSRNAVSDLRWPTRRAPRFIGHERSLDGERRHR
jgi:hypothetical protein